MSLQYISLENWSTCLCMHVCMPYPHTHRHTPSDDCWSLNFAVYLQTGDGSVINHRLWQIFRGFMQAHEPHPGKRKDWERHLNAEIFFLQISEEAGEQGWSQKVDSNLSMNCVVNRHSLRLDNTLSTPKLKSESVWNKNYLQCSALRQDEVLLKLLRQLQFYSILYSYWMCSTRDVTAVLCKYLHNNSGD